MAKKKNRREKKEIIAYILRKSIFHSDFYNDCNIVDCPISEATLCYEGNYYCLKHFIEIIQDDRCEKADLEWLFDNTNPTNYAGRRQKYNELKEKYLVDYNK